MLHHNENDLDVQRLMHEIRASVAGRGPIEEEKAALPGPTNGHFEQKNHYHVNDLLRFHGDEFVRNAYRTLLGREPDEAGMAHHLDQLASGRFNKIDVLASLRSSREGRSTPVRLDGLSLPVTVRRLGRVPVIGYLVRLGVALLRLPNSIQHQNRFEFYAWSQQRSIAARQDQHHKQLSEALQQISAQITEIMQGATEQQFALARQSRISDERFAEFTSKLNSVLASVNEKIASVREQITSLQQTVGEEQVALLLRQQKTEIELLMQERRLTVLLEAVGRESPSLPNRHLTDVAADEEEHLLDPLYAAFEDQFRGPRDEVRRRLQVYIPFLNKDGIRSDVLDLGCGRGEWLELLESESIEGRGVDRNRVFIEACRGAGLSVTQQDVLVHLRSLPGESLNAVTAFHLVEHLPFEMLVKLLDEIVRTLRRGGLVILETPNPENFMVGSCNFYADPTHRNPIPSNTLQFLVESRGLKTIEVVRLRSWDEARIEGDGELVKRFNDYFYSAPDYGIIAEKP